MQRTLTSASVVIATYNRPDHVRTCLEHLLRQTQVPEAILVVDASPGADTRAVVEEFDGVRYLRNDLGAGSTATSRAIGVAEVTSDVVAFLDDDAYAAPTWLAELTRRYADPRVGAVGGRALNGQPGEEVDGADTIGLLRADGTLTGFFAADPGADVDVDHMLGANMSVRRGAVLEVGGIHDHYPGTCLREETDIALRLRLAGYRIVFTPDAVVVHVAGPYAKGRRFDLRYSYYAQRNHVVLLARTVGVRDVRFRRYLVVAGRAAGGELGYAARALGRRHRQEDGSIVRGVGNGVARFFVTLGGVAGGLGATTRITLAEGPLRRPEVVAEVPSAS
ncbi:glycosyltransferase family 2 protein [Pengzhenrongella frigida]|uniref:Glycosyltransferase family 2 protein n=1 Tax=Pengzhenrongella frigida TaxID=1259133 RepID=A0A4Q5MY86_9MICO|nr:glycosyltransferase family 2 protein [Cellulomonas sp. HLT2-17]RYV50752.1 glycosyltransferase family 2 protein [Cellulomonas sp. HLT2-17]